MTVNPDGIMLRLREETSTLHQRAEGHDFQRALTNGALPQEGYLAFLSQMFLVHRALEQHLRDHRRTTSALQTVLRDFPYKEPQLRSDLDFFQIEPEAIPATPATVKLLAEIDRTAKADPRALLGYLYVLEGSTNGSKFVAKSVQQAYGLKPGPGTSYLDPYGDQQRERWQAFKQDMDAVGFTEPQIERIVATAKAMFEGIMAISSDLWRSTGNSKSCAHAKAV